MAKNWVDPSMVLCAVFLTVPMVLGADPGGGSTQDRSIGINTWFLNDWAPAKEFVDVVKHSRAFGPPGSPWEGGAPVDALGWPTGESFGVFLWAQNQSRMEGIYRISLKGDASGVDDRGRPRLQPNLGTIENLQYIPETDTTKADWKVLEGAGRDVWISFYGMKGGLKDLRVLRPGTKEGEVFTSDWLALCRKFGVIRFMDWTLTNNSPVKTWSDRTLPDHATQARNTGVAWEYCIELANQTNCDLWVNVPWKADEDYVTNLAQLLRSRVNPNLKIYVEWGNEMWNGIFSANLNKALAIQEVNTGKVRLDFDGESRDWPLAYRRIAEKSRMVSDRFRAVFGDEAMMTRVRPVFMTWLGNGLDSLGQGLKYLDGYYNNPKYVPNPHPVSYYLYGAGGSAYYYPDNENPNLSLDSLWTSRTFNTREYEKVLKIDLDLCQKYGLKRVAYEGGPSMDGASGPGAINGKVKAQAWADPRMRKLVVEHHQSWKKFSGDLLCYYAGCTSGPEWAFCQDITQQNTPKLQAIADLAR